MYDLFESLNRAHDLDEQTNSLRLSAQQKRDICSAIDNCFNGITVVNRRTDDVEELNVRSSYKDGKDCGNRYRYRFTLLPKYVTFSFIQDLDDSQNSRAAELKNKLERILAGMSFTVKSSSVLSGTDSYSDWYPVIELRVEESLYEATTSETTYEDDVDDEDDVYEALNSAHELDEQHKLSKNEIIYRYNFGLPLAQEYIDRIGTEQEHRNNAKKVKDIISAIKKWKPGATVTKKRDWNALSLLIRGIDPVSEDELEVLRGMLPTDFKYVDVYGGSTYDRYHALVSVSPEVRDVQFEARNRAHELVEATPIEDTNVFVWDGKSRVPEDVEHVKIADGVTNISDRAFWWNKNLKSVTIPNSVTSIGSHAFHYCTGLTSITIPDSVITIGRSAFSHCEGLTSVTIPNSVTTIGEDAFSNCYDMTSVTIGNSVTSIGREAFHYCYNLPSITIPDSVTTIGDYAFRNCYALTSITIPDSVASIGEDAFIGCPGVKEGAKEWGMYDLFEALNKAHKLDDYSEAVIEEGNRFFNEAWYDTKMSLQEIKESNDVELLRSTRKQIQGKITRVKATLHSGEGEERDLKWALRDFEEKLKAIKTRLNELKSSVNESISYGGEMNYTDDIISFIQNYDNGSMWDEFVITFEDVDDADLDASDIIEWMQNYLDMYHAFLTADDDADVTTDSNTSNNVSFEVICRKLQMPTFDEETYFGNTVAGVWTPKKADNIEDAARELYNALSSNNIEAEVEYWTDCRPYYLGNGNSNIQLQLTSKKNNTYTVRDITRRRM